MKMAFIIPALLMITGCSTSSLTPEQEAAVQANIERNRIDPSSEQVVSLGATQFLITQNKSRTVALVKAKPGSATIAMMEQAVEKQTNCSATAPTNLEERTGIDKNTPVRAEVFRSFAGAIPILTKC